jgi:hypothetical protein
MGVPDAIDLYGSRRSSSIGDNVIVPFVQLKVVQADRADEFGREIESLFDSLFVVSNTKDSSRESFLLSSYSTPEAILKVEVGLDVLPVSTSVKAALALVVSAEGRHVRSVSNVDDNVGLNVVNEVSKPFSSLVVVGKVGVLIRNNEMGCDRNGPSNTL